MRTPPHSPSPRTQPITRLVPQVPEGSDTAPAAGGRPAAPVRALRQQLEQEVAGEDPLNGELLVRTIDLPFVGPDEQEELRSWQL